LKKPPIIMSDDGAAWFRNGEQGSELGVDEGPLYERLEILQET